MKLVADCPLSQRGSSLIGLLATKEPPFVREFPRYSLALVTRARRVWVSETTHCRKWYKMDIDKDSEEYALWKEDHDPISQQNFDKSANAMEADGAIALWSRSIEMHNLR